MNDIIVAIPVNVEREYPYTMGDGQNGESRFSPLTAGVNGICALR